MKNKTIFYNSPLILYSIKTLKKKTEQQDNNSGNNIVKTATTMRKFYAR